jgi:ABC-type amino acid transport substrate-binding protein
VALYPPTYTKDPRTGQLSGWTIDVIRALGERLGVEGQPVERRTPPEAVACLVAGDCDVAILGIELYGQRRWTSRRRSSSWTTPC